MNTTKNETVFGLQVLGYNGRWTDSGPEFIFATREAAEHRIKIQRRDDFDMGLPALKYRVVEVVR